MGAKKNKRQTFQKLKREQAVKERHAKKLERRSAARLAKVDGTEAVGVGEESNEEVQRVPLG